MEHGSATTVAAEKRVRSLFETPVGASPTLPPELMAEAAWRLGWLGLVYACGVLFGYFGRRALLTWSGTIEAGLRAPDLISIAAIVMGLAIFVLSRRHTLPPRRLVD